MLLPHISQRGTVHLIAVVLPFGTNSKKKEGLRLLHPSEGLPGFVGYTIFSLPLRFKPVLPRKNGQSRRLCFGSNENK